MLKKSVFCLLVSVIGLLSYTQLGIAQEAAKRSNLPSTTPIIADHEVRSYGRDNPEGNVLVGKFYRDQFGRTRLEEGDLVSINDPVAKLTLLLNSRTNSFQKIEWQQNPVLPIAESNEANIISKSKALGTHIIEGLQAYGQESISMIPANSIGNSDVIETTTTLWVSKKAQLPLRHIYKDSLGNLGITMLKNIKMDVALDPSLFRVPANYTNYVDSYTDAKGKIAPLAACPITLSSTYVTVPPNGSVTVTASAPGGNIAYSYSVTTSPLLAQTATFPCPCPNPNNCSEGPVGPNCKCSGIATFSDGRPSNPGSAPATGSATFVKSNNGTLHTVYATLPE